MSKEKSRSPKPQKAGSKTSPKNRAEKAPAKDADDRRVKQGDYSDKYSSGGKVS